jgi:hypothetical protein
VVNIKAISVGDFGLKLIKSKSKQGCLCCHYSVKDSWVYNIRGSQFVGYLHIDCIKDFYLKLKNGIERNKDKMMLENL